MRTPPTSATASTADDVKYNCFFLWSACLVAALGGLLFGYDWVVISGADIFYEKFFNLTAATDIGWAKSCALAGCLAGSVVAGALSDRFGRKRLLILSAVLFTVSSLGTGLADTFSVFVAWRIVGGAAIGLASKFVSRCISQKLHRASPRQAGFAKPTQHRHRHRACPVCQLVGGPTRPVGSNGAGHCEFVEWPVWLAVDVLSHRRSLGTVPGGNVLRAGKSRWLIKNGQRQRAASRAQLPRW